MNFKYRKGFTLVELSIVLIIIGLIVGGILAEKSLIDAAKIRAQITQLEDYKKAYYTFKLKYDAVPGDMVDASDYWPGSNDGDGTGRIEPPANKVWEIGEGLFLFEHLSLAKMIQGSYDGSFAMNTGYPSLKIDSGKGMVAAGYITDGGSIGRWQLTAAIGRKRYTAALNLQVSNPAVSDSTSHHNGGVMTVLQAYNMDTKIDDGSASSGIYISYKTWENPMTTGCLDGGGGEYLLSEPDNLQCMSMYVVEK